MGLSEAVSGPWLYKKIRKFQSNSKARTYIIPTAFGLSFSAMALVLFFLAVGYSNNLMYGFLFFLISVALTATVMANRNIDVLEVQLFQAGPVFAKERNHIAINLKNLSSRECHNFSFFTAKTEEPSSIEYLAPFESKSAEVEWIPGSRGVCLLPKTTLQSTFPFGLLRAWRSLRSERNIIVFPERRGEVQFPKSSFQPEGLDNVGLFRDHRQFQASDSLRRIDWRASARRQELLVKNLEESNKKILLFRWEDTDTLEGIEARLSQLSLWVDEAEKAGHSYGLKLDQHMIEMSHGHSHWKKCMETLALYASSP